MLVQLSIATKGVSAPTAGKIPDDPNGIPIAPGMAEHKFEEAIDTMVKKGENRHVLSHQALVLTLLTISWVDVLQAGKMTTSCTLRQQVPRVPSLSKYHAR